MTLERLGEDFLDAVLGIGSGLPKAEYIEKVGTAEEMKWLFSAKDFRNKVITMIDGGKK